MKAVGSDKQGRGKGRRSGIESIYGEEDGREARDHCPPGRGGEKHEGPLTGERIKRRISESDQLFRRKAYKRQVSKEE